MCFLQARIVFFMMEDSWRELKTERNPRLLWLAQ